ncbi:branched-chain amino acid ABC transporter permease [Noviherbaspirillum pedocola]|uniref:Branched-chain amino acid ABC transporter permease n=1 Tax=Noviherbaspirillum pedocola TaxID=2801341 RepID=A0A934T0G2_9BURK|nr:branched-chain amino acid ABC transporter permease [Noviherbaspirillum pedocola]MBK4738710.1 branched-chain amino acid ABC transporter permease [Noviherbaspirillum pedocola]
MNSLPTVSASTDLASAASTRRRLLPRAVLVGLLLVVAAAFPFLAKGYVIFQATMVLSYAVALLGLNIVTGYNGQISLGHGAFYAIGAYTSAILMEQAGMPYWATVLAAGVVCLVAGYVFGLPALKLEGLYLALATFALAVATPQLLKYKHLESWTGGVQGIVLMKPDAPLGLPLSQDQWLYLFSLAVALVMFWLAHNLLGSGVGRAIVAIRDNPIAAETMGVNNRHYKASVFGVSAMYTGIGGALSAIAVQFVAPDSFTMFLSISLLVGIVVGGIGTISGAIYGAVFIMFVPSAAEKVSKAAPWAVYGLVLILFVFVMPGGVAGLLRKLRQRRSA